MTPPSPHLPRLIAHRGLSAHAPENTRAAVRAAHRAGFHWVELDVQLLGDGTPVIWHDPGMKRCSDGRGKLRKMHLEQAREYDVGAWFSAEFRGERMATLDEMLSLISRLDMGLNLELKVCRGRDPIALAKAVVPQFLEALPFERRLLSSFHYHALKQARHMADPDELALGVLSKQLPQRWREKMDTLQAYSLHTDWKQLKEKRAREVKEAGIPLLCYTANDPLAFGPRWDWGVTSVISDDPQCFMN